MKLDAREAVKMCLYGTFGGYLSHRGAPAGWLNDLLNPALASFIDVVEDIMGSILLIYTIWWLVKTIGAIGRSSQGSTHT